MVSRHTGGDKDDADVTRCEMGVPTVPATVLTPSASLSHPTFCLSTAGSVLAVSPVSGALAAPLGGAGVAGVALPGPRREQREKEENWTQGEAHLCRWRGYAGGRVRAPGGSAFGGVGLCGLGAAADSAGSPRLAVDGGNGEAIGSVVISSVGVTGGWRKANHLRRWFRLRDWGLRLLVGLDELHCQPRDGGLSPSNGSSASGSGERTTQSSSVGRAEGVGEVRLLLTWLVCSLGARCALLIGLVAREDCRLAREGGR
eukprot:1181832-Prorocentrum_minimum.AAC.4